ncbi:Stf0 family sulfotransferase [Sphingomonas asaccharolytica]|uniref:Stf0 family sulfotransferase n=1 Tax=Sphingomonas asaccharolytica TaxID=40681 RepID=UPI000833265F|nr:Stf0 family sulfotransferase [Sphingomonas asaccharolytica]
MSINAPPRHPYDLTLADRDYPEWIGPPRRSLLICTLPRSGSTLLSEALHFAGGLGCPLEYFHRGFRPDFVERWDAGTLPDYIRAVHRWRTDPSGVLSVKLFWGDVEALAAEMAPSRFGGLAGCAPGNVDAGTYREIAALLNPIFPSPHFIHLERKDRVRQAVSGLSATQTGLFRIVPSTETPPVKATPEYDFTRIDSLIAYADYCHGHWRNFFDAIRADPIRLTYEDLVADYEGSVRHVLNGIGSNSPIPTARLQRQSSSDNETFVLRYLRDRQAVAE